MFALGFNAAKSSGTVYEETELIFATKILEPSSLCLGQMPLGDPTPTTRTRSNPRLQHAKCFLCGTSRRVSVYAVMGSDAVVKAYNNLMQSFFQRGEQSASPEGDAVAIMSMLGTFLLEIRKDLGNEATKLDHWDMLEWFLADARKYRQNA